MKNKNVIFSYVFVHLMIAILLISSSCSKETGQQEKDSPANINLQLIKISGSDASSATKTTLSGLVTSWVMTTDKVGIYSPQARTASAAGGNPIVNAQFTAASTGISSDFSGTMYWGATDTPHTFYAYYPYKSGTAASTVVPVSLATAQIQASANSNAHLGALDFLVANPTTVISPDNTAQIANEVNLKYNHVFSVIEFQIKGTGTSLGTSLKAVKLIGASNFLAFSGGTINITQVTPEAGTAYTFASQTGKTNEVVVSLTSAATLSETNTDTKVYMVINPGTQTGTCLIGLSSDGSTWTYISKEAPEGGFLRGMKYVVTLDKAESASLVDQESNNFDIVTIGTQTWMAENLKTTKYNDGTAIQNVTLNSEWGSLATGAYCDYSNTALNSTTYGRLYNWFAVDNNASTKAASNGGKNICPVGWHVPTNTEWNTLTTFLGGVDIAGGKLKEAGTTHWVSPNEGATNSTGFTALPGGWRYENGGFSDLGQYGHWWTTTSYDTFNARRRVMFYFDSEASSGYTDKQCGLSVRCLRN